LLSQDGSDPANTRGVAASKSRHAAWLFVLNDPDRMMNHPFARKNFSSILRWTPCNMGEARG
jgi:hypothetical protein